MSMKSLNDPQPMPLPVDGPDIWELVIVDMRQRNAVGLGKYGVPLRAGDGRDHLVDAYQEALDLAVYLRQEIQERGAGVRFRRRIHPGLWFYLILLALILADLVRHA